MAPEDGRGDRGKHVVRGNEFSALPALCLRVARFFRAVSDPLKHISGNMSNNTRSQWHGKSNIEHSYRDIRTQQTTQTNHFCPQVNDLPCPHLEGAAPRERAERVASLNAFRSSALTHFAK